MYVQLLQFQSLSGLHILQKINMNDLTFSLDDCLVVEMERLNQLEQETIAL